MERKEKMETKEEKKIGPHQKTETSMFSIIFATLLALVMLVLFLFKEKDGNYLLKDMKKTLEEIVELEKRKKDGDDTIFPCNDGVFDFYTKGLF